MLEPRRRSASAVTKDQTVSASVTRNALRRHEGASGLAGSWRMSRRQAATLPSLATLAGTSSPGALVSSRRRLFSLPDHHGERRLAVCFEDEDVVLVRRYGAAQGAREDDVAGVERGPEGMQLAGEPGDGTSKPIPFHVRRG
jgi:hypothetical protein